MRRMISIALMLFAVMTAGAQEMELLDSIRQNPDPMYKERGGMTIWTSEHMAFIIYDNDTMEWRIKNPPHIFISDRSKWTGQDLGYSYARVGLFAENDSLLGMVDKWKVVPSKHGTILNMTSSATFDRPNGEKLKGTMANVWVTLNQRKGSYVRVVTKVYGDYYFEVKATLNK